MLHPLRDSGILGVSGKYRQGGWTLSPSSTSSLFGFCRPVATTHSQAASKRAILHVSKDYHDLIMTLTDAIIVLLLAEKIHGTEEAIRRAAKNMAKRLPRSKRGLMYDIAESKNPRDLMRHIALGLDD